MDTKRYKYYLDFSTFVTRNKTIYITMNLAEFFFFYLSLVDAINNKFQNDETLYSIPNIFAKLVFKKINKDILFAVLIIIIIINYIFIFFYAIIYIALFDFIFFWSIETIMFMQFMIFI